MANEETRQSDERFERQVTDQNTIIECNSSQDCPRGSGQTCVDGQCVDTVTSSFISNEKPDDSSIQPVVPDGFSKPDAIDTGDFSALPPVKECRSDRDCPPGQNCLDGKCTSSFDQPVFENWWELTDEYRYLGNLISPIIERTDEADNTSGLPVPLVLLPRIWFVAIFCILVS